MSKSTFQLKKIFIAMLTTGCVVSAQAQQTFAPVESPQDIKRSINFLTATTDNSGINYIGSIGDLRDLLLPLSFHATADYWGKYVCNLPGNNCTVQDIYNPNDYTLTPDFKNYQLGGDLQTERVDVANGSDIYDTATWQIALALAGNAGLTAPGGKSLFEILESHNKILYYGYDGNSPVVQNGANRGTTKGDGTFTYNGTSITNPKNAYFFRMITRSWLSTDPFMDTDYKKFLLPAVGIPNNPDYKTGKMTWLDWKPITGENTWAFFVGPLQAAQIKYQAFPGSKAYVPFDSMAVQNASDVLFAFQAMQSEIGAIYYAVKGSLGNVGSEVVNPYQASVENNASTLAGLLVFKSVLQQELANEPNVDKVKVEKLIANIDTMIFGGNTPSGKKTEGLLSFLKNYAWNKEKSEFYSGGLANEPNKPIWIPAPEGAVDVNTWTVSVLGQPMIDSWHGFGSAFRVWENIKKWGAFYGPDATVWGVGFSDRDGNGEGKDYKKGIISAEWTAGAINMVRVLITQYQQVADSDKSTTEEKKQAREFIAKLRKDHDSMMDHIMSLRTDKYPTEAAFDQVRPANYSSLIPMPEDKLAFLYASSRFFIPFGWFSNPIPSTTSTAWSIMLYYNFNPFSVTGTYNANTFERSSSDGSLSEAVDALVKNEVKDGTIVVRAKTNGDTWQTLLKLKPTEQATTTFPKGTTRIVVTWGPTGTEDWGACQVANPSFLSNYKPVIFHAIWTNDQGTGECLLEKGSSLRSSQRS